jgi:hypothetical protein
VLKGYWILWNIPTKEVQFKPVRTWKLYYFHSCHNMKTVFSHVYPVWHQVPPAGGVQSIYLYTTLFRILPIQLSATHAGMVNMRAWCVSIILRSRGGTLHRCIDAPILLAVRCMNWFTALEIVESRYFIFFTIPTKTFLFITFIPIETDIWPTISHLLAVVITSHTAERHYLLV